jgi:hypothetical protein
MAKVRINNKIQELWHQVKCDRAWINLGHDKNDHFGNFNNKIKNQKLFAIKVLRQLKYKS